MIKLNFSGSRTMGQTLGITKEREEDLDFELSIKAHDIFKPRKRGEKEPVANELIQAFSEVAKTNEELVFCMFNAGIEIARTSVE